ncbi:MAG: hypothetical protein IIB36_01355 [Gemmatimonadetes bacterium]|nr:hypothetical protein [Gemmatimonadota bacterium]
MAAKKPYKHGSHTFPLELPPNLNLDLHAFCTLYFNAPKSEVARRALQRVIQRETVHPDKKREFEAIRRRLSGMTDATLQIVERKDGEGENELPTRNADGNP